MPLVLVVVALQVATQLLVNTLWFLIAHKINIPISFLQMLYVNCQGSIIDAITPGVKFGGEVTRGVQISRVANCTGEVSATLIALQKLFSLSAMLFVMLFAVGYYFTGPTRLLVVGMLLLLLSVFCGVLVAPGRVEEYFRTKNASRFLWIRKARGFLISLMGQVAIIRENIKGSVFLFVLALLIWLLYPMKLYLLAMHIMPDVSVIQMIAVAFVPYLVAMIPILPGGVGGFEGAMSGLMIASGFIVSEAVAVTIVFRFITFWFVMLMGLGFISLYRTKVKSL